MKNYFDLTGKVAFVSGASSGLGSQFAKSLANQGASVAIAARRTERLAKVKADIEAMNVECLAVRCDVTDEESIINCVDTIKKEFGRIDILCNNAGIESANDFLAFETDEWDRHFDTNLKSMFLMSREVGKLMEEQSYGKIINTASIAGYGGAAGRIAYYASKGGVINFTRALAADMAPYNVTVNAIGPGVFDTELTHDDLENEYSQHVKASIPLKRFGMEGELDGILIYFASDASIYCTGQTLYVDGGLTSVI